MSKSVFFALVFSSLVSFSVSFAHEGEHNAPGSVPAQKGGVIRSTEDLHLELVSSGKEVRIYPIGLDLKPMDPKAVEITATVALPRKKAEPVVLTAQADHWLFSFDAKGAHRFTVTLNLKHDGENHKVSWTVEPRKERK